MFYAYESSGYNGYSFSFKGNTSKPTIMTSFNSIKVYPKSDIVLFDRNNELLNIHNGSRTQIIIINNIQSYFKKHNIKYASSALSFVLKSIKPDNIMLIKNTTTGEIITDVSTMSLAFNSPLLNLIILVLSIFGIYYIYITYIKRYVWKVKEAINVVSA